MAAWIPVPEPVTWQMPDPIANNGVTYQTVTLRAPTGEQLLKAMAIPGASATDVTHRLIAEVSAEKVPYDVVKKLPWWMIEKMDGYMSLFAGAPDPDPLEAWRQARRDALAADAAGATPAA